MTSANLLDNGYSGWIGNHTETNNTEYDNKYFDEREGGHGLYTEVGDYAIGAIYLTESFLGVMLNLLTIMIVGCGKSFSNEIKIQLINMAIADLLTSLLYPTTEMMKYLRLAFPGDLTFCRVVQFLRQTAVHAGPICNAAISFERLVTVFFPFRKTHFNRIRNYVIIVVIWVWAIGPEIPRAMHATVIMKYGHKTCNASLPLWKSNKSLLFWITTMKFVIPSAIMVVCHTLVGVKLWLRKKRCAKNSTSSSWKRKLVKVQVMLAVDAAVTLITILPYTLYMSIMFSIMDGSNLYALDRKRGIVIVALSLLLCVNCFSTPVVYFLFNKDFCRDAKLLFKHTKCANNGSSQSADIATPGTLGLSEQRSVAYEESFEDK